MKTHVPRPSNAWFIPGVQYRNGIHNVELGKSPLENGVSKTQDGWASYREQEKPKGELFPPDYPLFYGIVKASYLASNDSSKTQSAEEVRKFLKNTSRERWLMMLTRISHKAKGNDTIIHNFGTKDRYEQKVNFTGPDEWLKDTKNIVPYQALLGTKDNKQEINDIFKWLNGTDAYMIRINSKQNTERVAWFVAGSGRAVLYCCRYPSVTYASLGVRFVSSEAANSPKIKEAYSPRQISNALNRIRQGKLEEKLLSALRR